MAVFFFDSIFIFRDASSVCGWAFGKLLGSFRLRHMDDCSYIVNCLLTFPGKGAAKWVHPGALVGQSQVQAERVRERASKVEPWEKVKAKELKTVTLKCNAPAGVREKSTDGQPVRGSIS